MKKQILTLTIILAMLLAGAFLPMLVPTVHAITGNQNILAEQPQPDPASAAPSNNPVVQVIVGMAATLFAALTFLPYLWQENSLDGTARMDRYND